MLKKRLGVMAFAATTALIVGCGDDVTKITESDNLMSIVDSLDSTVCNESVEGMQVFVKDSLATFMCVDGDWLMMNSASNAKISCSAKSLKDSSGYTIICNGDSVATIYNGKQGKAGKDADNCSLKTVKNGVEISCPDTTLVVKNGEQGKQGEQGEQGKQGEEGKQGKTGEACTLEETDAGVTVTCGEKKYSLKNGEAGESCFVKSQSDSTIVVGCGDDDSKDLVIPVYQENKNLGKTYSREIAVKIYANSVSSMSSRNLSVLELDPQKLAPTGKAFSFQMASAELSDENEDEYLTFSKNISVSNLESPYVLACTQYEMYLSNSFCQDKYDENYASISECDSYYLGKITSNRVACGLVDLSQEGTAFLNLETDYIYERAAYLAQKKGTEVDKALAQAKKELEKFGVNDAILMNVEEILEYQTRLGADNIESMKKGFAETGSFNEKSIEVTDEETIYDLREILNRRDVSPMSIVDFLFYKRSYDYDSVTSFISKSWNLPNCVDEPVFMRLQNENSLFNGWHISCQQSYGYWYWTLASDALVKENVECSADNEWETFVGYYGGYRCQKNEENAYEWVNLDYNSFYFGVCGTETKAAEAGSLAEWAEGDYKFPEAEGAVLRCKNHEWIELYAYDFLESCTATNEGDIQKSFGELYKCSMGDWRPVEEKYAQVTGFLCRKDSSEIAKAVGTEMEVKDLISSDSDPYRVACVEDVMGNETYYTWMEADEITDKLGFCTTGKWGTLADEDRYVCFSGFWSSCGDVIQDGFALQIFNRYYECRGEEHKWIDLSEEMGECTNENEGTFFPVGKEIYECTELSWSITKTIPCSSNDENVIFNEEFVCDGTRWKKIEPTESLLEEP